MLVIIVEYLLRFYSIYTRLELRIYDLILISIIYLDRLIRRLLGDKMRDLDFDLVDNYTRLAGYIARNLDVMSITRSSNFDLSSSLRQ